MLQPSTSASRASSFVSFVWYRMESSMETSSAIAAQYSRRYTAYATGTTMATLEAWQSLICLITKAIFLSRCLFLSNGIRFVDPRYICVSLRLYRSRGVDRRRRTFHNVLPTFIDGAHACLCRGNWPHWLWSVFDWQTGAASESHEQKNVVTGREPRSGPVEHGLEGACQTLVNPQAWHETVHDLTASCLHHRRSLHYCTTTGLANRRSSARSTARSMARSTARASAARVSAA
jgi:hypothetical protein